MKPDPKFTSQIITTVLRGKSIHPECDVLSFEDDSGRIHFQGSALIASSHRQFCLFTLPTDGVGIYIVVSDRDRDRALLESVLAMLESMEGRDGFRVGDVVELDLGELRNENLGGVLLLQPGACTVLSHIPNELSGPAGTHYVLLVMCLTERQLQFWHARGTAALMASLGTPEGVAH